MVVIIVTQRLYNFILRIAVLPQYLVFRQAWFIWHIYIVGLFLLDILNTEWFNMDTKIVTQNLNLWKGCINFISCLFFLILILILTRRIRQDNIKVCQVMLATNCTYYVCVSLYNKDIDYFQKYFLIITDVWTL